MSAVASEVVICLLTSVFSAQMIVPGSHRYGHRPPPEVQDEHPPGAEHLEVPAGTTVIVRLQHLFCILPALLLGLTAPLAAVRFEDVAPEPLEPLGIRPPRDLEQRAAQVGDADGASRGRDERVPRGRAL